MLDDATVTIDLRDMHPDCCERIERRVLRPRNIRKLPGRHLAMSAKRGDYAFLHSGAIPDNFFPTVRALHGSVQYNRNATARTKAIM